MTLRLTWSRTGKIAFDPYRSGNHEILVVFESDRDGNAEIYAMNANGSGVTRLTHNSAFDLDPAWGP